MVGVSNFRHAQYDVQGIGIDDPQSPLLGVKQDPLTGAINSRFLSTAPGQLNCCLVGDSLLANYVGSVGAGQTLYQLGEHSIALWAERFSLGRLRIAQVLAVSGSRLVTHQIQADQINSLVTPLVIENGGVNDIVGDDAGVDYVVAARVEVWRRLQLKGASVIALSVLPPNAAGFSSLSKSQKIAAVNIKLADRAIRMGVRFVNLAALITDPADANGYPRANWTWDGLHTSVLGAYNLGRALWNAIASDPIGRQDYPLAMSAVDGWASGTPNAVWHTNPLFTGTSGTVGTGITGNVSTGWDVQRSAGLPTAVCSVIADPDGYGSALQLAVTAAAPNDAIDVRGPFAVNDTLLNDVVQGEVICRVVSGTNVAAVMPWLLIQVNASNFFAYGGSTSASFLVGGTPADNVPYLLRTPPVPCNNLARNGTTLNGLRLMITCAFSSAGSATLLFSRARGRRGLL